MRDCRDCLYCKAVRSKLLIFCKIDQWTKGNGDQRRVKMRKQTEFYTSDIEWRDIFAQAERCLSFHSMDE